MNRDVIANPGLMDEKDLAKHLKLSVSTIRRLRGASEGPKIYRVGKSVRYRLSDVEAWLQKECVEAR